MRWLFTVFSRKPCRCASSPYRISLFLCDKFWGFFRRFPWSWIILCPLFFSFFFVYFIEKIEDVICGLLRINLGQFLFSGTLWQFKGARILVWVCFLDLFVILLIFVHKLLCLFKHILRMEYSVWKLLSKGVIWEHGANPISQKRSLKNLIYGWSLFRLHLKQRIYQMFHILAISALRQILVGTRDNLNGQLMQILSIKGRF